ncbi:MAG: 4-hydroxy-tetrahydrodipicolinate synthase [Marinilabiliales bacterium]|nr:MAG: 4-hydroxy-tetrahydrodipicolinate synthase [Marinilabiliales bacterium]
MIQGTGAAIVTPFNKSGEIDKKSLESLINHLINNGTDFIVSLGTTSEAVTLNKLEKDVVISLVKEYVRGRVPIVMGLGGNSTAGVCEEINNTNFDGVDAILSVAPYYNKPNQRGIYAHFAEIAKICPVPIILYNVPGRTSSNISASTCIKLANDFEKIVAVKEASGDMNQVMEIIKNRPKDFSVLSGDDALTYPMMTLGGNGVISVVAMAYPKEFSDMVNLCLKGDYEGAKQLHYSLVEFIDLLFEDGNPAGIKASLEVIGLLENNLRLPMVPVLNDHYAAIKKFITEYKQP